MTRRECYDSSQWQFMNSPKGQENIRVALKKYLRTFLDSAPEGGELARVNEVLNGPEVLRTRASISRRNW